MTNLLKEKYIRAALYVFMFIAFSCLCYLFPYTHDDWPWGSTEGLDRLYNWFYNYNGRYAGNLLAILLTRFRIVKAIVEAACLVGIVYLIVSRNRKENFLFCTVVGFLLIAAIPKQILRQAVVWTSGFVNYGISILLVLIYVNICYKMFEKNADSQLTFRRRHAAPVMALAFVSALFVESITLYLIALSIAVILYAYCKFHKVYAVHIGYLAGAVLGACFMFSNETYRTIADNRDFYRSIGIGNDFVQRILNNYFSVIGKELFLNNFILNVFISIVIAILYHKFKKTMKQKAIAACSMIVIEGTCLFSFAVNVVRIFFRKDLGGDGLYGVITLLFCISLVLFCFTAVGERVLKQKLLFIVGSIAFMTAPLLAVSPIGSRCFFATYIMFSFFVAEGLREIRKSNGLRALAAAALILALANLFRIYVPVYHADINRYKTIREAAASGKAQIEIPVLPHENYLWHSTPEHDDSYWWNAYKDFYRLDSDVKIVTVENIKKTDQK